jgi:hypothetical protein
MAQATKTIVGTWIKSAMRDDAEDLPVSSLRHYDGQVHVHTHDYAQIMMPLAGRMDLEINGHSPFTDPSCGRVIPAGALRQARASLDSCPASMLPS